MKPGKQRYAVMFGSLAVGMIASGSSVFPLVHWLAILMFYTALSFAYMAAVYYEGTSTYLGKKPDGRLSIWSWIPLGPYFLANLVTFRLYRLFAHGPAYVEVIPQLYFGRRLSRREAQAGCLLGWQGVLDLATEFTETRPLRMLPGYRSLPLLDATAPPAEKLTEAIAWLGSALRSGPVYVHCAFGHGRSACLVIGYLLSLGVVKSVAEGETLLRSMRHGVVLNADQRTVLSRVFNH